MGLQLALGAAPSDLYRLVLRRGLLLTGVGLAVGSAGAVAASPALQGLLYEIDRFDLVAFGGMAVVMWVTAPMASVIPARRAARADPLVGLRSE